MSHAFIGVGQCGCGILDAIFEHKNMFRVATPIAVNSATQDLMNLKNIPRKFWLGVSRNYGLVEGTTRGFDELVTGGFGKNPQRGSLIVEEHYRQLKDVLTGRIGGKRTKESKQERETPFLFLSLGLGGGTGSGTAHAIARAVKELYDIPIIVIAVLPAKREGTITAWNAWLSLNKLFDYADSFILVDNERISHFKSMESLYKAYNTYIADGITDLVTATILEKIKPTDFEVNPPVIDVQDMITATSFYGTQVSKPGFAVMGKVTDRIRDLAHYLVPLGGYKKLSSAYMIQRAMKMLTVPGVDPGNAMKNLALLRLPAHYVKKRGKLNTNEIIEILRKYSTTQETHFGIGLTRRNLASLTLLETFSPDKIPRLWEIENMAREHEKLSMRIFE